MLRAQISFLVFWMMRVAINSILWMVFANGNRIRSHTCNTKCCIYGMWDVDNNMLIQWALDFWSFFMVDTTVTIFAVHNRRQNSSKMGNVKCETTKRRPKSYPFRIITLTWLLFSFVSCYFLHFFVHSLRLRLHSEPFILKFFFFVVLVRG